MELEVYKKFKRLNSLVVGLQGYKVEKLQGCRVLNVST